MLIRATIGKKTALLCHQQVCRWILYILMKRKIDVPYRPLAGEAGLEKVLIKLSSSSLVDTCTCFSSES